MQMKRLSLCAVFLIQVNNSPLLNDLFMAILFS